MRFRSPPVGMTVQFWPGGVKEHGSEPVAAVVVENGNNGMVKLNGLYPGGGDQRTSGEFVRYIHDPWVEANRHLLRGGSGTMVRGAWDFVPVFTADDMVIREYEEAAPQPKVDRKPEGLKRAEQMLSAGKSIDEVHRVVRGFGVTKADLEELAAVHV